MSHGITRPQSKLTGRREMFYYLINGPINEFAVMPWGTAAPNLELLRMPWTKKCLRLSTLNKHKRINRHCCITLHRKLYYSRSRQYTLQDIYRREKGNWAGSWGCNSGLEGFWLFNSCLYNRRLGFSLKITKDIEHYSQFQLNILGDCRIRNY